MCDYRLLLKSLTLSWQMSFSLFQINDSHHHLWMITVLWLWMLTWQPFTLLSSDIFSPPFLFFCSSISNPNFFLSFHLLFHNDFVPYYLLPYFVFTLTTFPMFSLLHSSSFFSSWFYSFLPFSLCIPYLLAILFFFFLCLLFSPCCVFFLLFSWVSFSVYS